MRAFVAAWLILLHSIAPVSAETQIPQVLHNALENYVAPSYLHLKDTTVHLSERISRLCGEPDARRLNASREAFHATVRAWSAIEWFRAGPVLHNDRVERFFFFPDRRGVGLRQVQKVLAQPDETVVDPASLRKKSVALQGLGTLDYLLFGRDSGSLETGNGFRC